MPYVENMSLTEAYNLLTSLGLFVELQGDGGIIKQQLPVVGTMLFKGQNIVLIT